MSDDTPKGSTENKEHLDQPKAAAELPDQELTQEQLDKLSGGSKKPAYYLP